MEKLHAWPLGTVVHDTTSEPWVYIGYRTTSTGSREHLFVKALDGRRGLAMEPWTYKGSRYDTLRRKFPDLRRSEEKP